MFELTARTHDSLPGHEPDCGQTRTELALVAVQAIVTVSGEPCTVDGTSVT